MSPAESAAPQVQQLTIRFYGLCMFATASTGNDLHVFLAQPGMNMEHLSTLRHSPHSVGSAEKWKARRLAKGFDADWRGTDTAAVQRPSEKEMSNVSRLPDGAAPSLATALSRNAKVGGSHIILRGGTLSLVAGERVGLWTIPTQPQVGELRFPRAVEWTGQVGNAAPQTSGRIELWHAMPDESPTVPKDGSDSDDPRPLAGGTPQGIGRGKMHFQAYYQLMTGKGGADIDYAGDAPYPIAATTKASSKSLPFTILVASCPSVTGDVLIP